MVYPHRRASCVWMFGEELPVRLSFLVFILVRDSGKEREGIKSFFPSTLYYPPSRKYQKLLFQRFMLGHMPFFYFFERGSLIPCFVTYWIEELTVGRAKPTTTFSPDYHHLERKIVWNQLHTQKLLDRLKGTYLLLFLCHEHPLRRRSEWIQALITAQGEQLNSLLQHFIETFSCF